ncbi:carbon monoxide dehydrogenase [Oceanicola sp. 22II-s10i]|uniref:FAD binding domain-containing protein n=1 Tax=Oceanicola sp. 22II-s10i TaxID=1317116 RepID=UPI000B51EEE9|nr:xanthine dehydrogenase family protein subunit M [Oceanicola sp. 22II-s10i]OWU84291.1 carbon monoxide dehydrogenase [Oceanicola sp. 22II-s10i]
MYPTKYHKPADIDAAVAALGSGEDPKVLAGGQTLIATMKQHLASPSDLIDIRGLGLSGISASGGGVTIGATTVHAEVAASKDVHPALAKLAGGIGDPMVRNAGTIGGSIANNDPAADYPSAVLGMGATVVTNRREIAADDYFQGLFMTALEEGEIVTAVKFPAVEKAGYAKFKQPASRFCLVGVFVAKTANGARVAVTGAGEDGVFRHAGLEAALSSNWSPDAVAGVDVSADGLLSDIHGDAEYRANLIRVMAKRAVAAS